MYINRRWRYLILCLLALTLLLSGASAFGPRASYLSSNFTISSFPLLVQLLILTDMHSTVLIGRLCIAIAILLLAMSISMGSIMRVISLLISIAIPLIIVYSQYTLRYYVAKSGSFFLLNEVHYAWHNIFYTSISTSLLYIIPALIISYLSFIVRIVRSNYSG